MALVLLLVVAALAWRWYDARGMGSLPPRGGGPLTVVATGDALMLGRFTRGQQRLASAMVPLLASADVALTNLEVNLLAPEHVPDGTTTGRARWPYATEDSGADLRRMGINVVSVANNHTGDYGVDGIRDTRRILDRVGLQHVGSGDDLEGARAPIVVGRSPRRVAVIAVSTSSSVESRATSTRGEIQGRPGLNPLRFTANVTADPITFETLRSTAAAPQDTQPGDSNTLRLLGATIKKGTQTVVDFAIDESDLRQILSRIEKARGEADVVIVSLHSHEPSNGSDTPAEFVRQFAHAAIDAGAALVVGHGPHRIRGVEAYGRGAILYSVGNFIFPTRTLDRRAADVYDAGVDLYWMAIGAVDFDEPHMLQGFEEPIWREGLIAKATFDKGALASLQLWPVDLDGGGPKDEQGIPRLATADRARAIIDRLSRLSAQFDTRVSFADGTVIVDLVSGGR